MKNQNRAAVILANWGDYAEKYLEACYASLKAQTYPQDLYTIFIVNNNLTEKYTKLTREIAADARIVDNERNCGWPGANNKAVKIALKEGFDYIVILNMDTVLDKNWLQSLIQKADKDRSLHIIQSKILLYGTDIINSIGNRIHYLGYGYCCGFGRKDSISEPDSSIDFASGASMLVKRKVFRKIGLFREEYFMYYDDMEFCWRARVAGFSIGLAPQSVCYHRYKLEDKLQRLYTMERNRLVTFFTLQKIRTIMIKIPPLVLTQLISVVYFTAKGYGSQLWNLAKYFTKRRSWKSIAARRRQIRLLRAKKDRDIVSQFAGDIFFAQIKSPLLRYIANPLLRLYWAAARKLIFW